MKEDLVIQQNAILNFVFKSTKVSDSEKGWQYLSLLILVFLSVPIASIVFISLGQSGDLWKHLFDTVLPKYILTTLSLMIGSVIGATIIGVSTAWVTSAYDFKGKTLLSTLLTLPLAMPAYLMAYVWTDLLEYAGPLQNSLRSFFIWKSSQDYWFPEIRSLGGAIFLFSFVLYPYIFFLARTAFLNHALKTLRIGKMLGQSTSHVLMTATIPLARPAIIVGASLVLMEVLADYGTVSFFGINTLSKGVFDLWLNMNDLAAASQLSLIVLFFVFFLLGSERWSRRTQRFSLKPLENSSQKKELSWQMTLLVWLSCAVPITIGFVIPVITLFSKSILSKNTWEIQKLWVIVQQTVSLALMASCAACLLAILIGFGVRLQRGSSTKWLAQFGSISYAFPGTILALGVLWPLSSIDNAMDLLMREWFGISSGLLFSGTAFALVAAYVIRFLAVAYGSVDSGFQAIPKAMDKLPRLLGKELRFTLVSIHLPLLKSSLMTASLIVFVEVMKELPATLILRPFGVETLATHVYQYASSEQLAAASPAALLIVLVGVWPVLVINRVFSKNR